MLELILFGAAALLVQDEEPREDAAAEHMEASEAADASYMAEASEEAEASFDMATPEWGPAGYVYFVQNNTNLALHCRGGSTPSTLGAFETRQPGGEWRFDASSGNYRLHCKSPVTQAAFKLIPGNNYALQRQPPGGPRVDLIRISAD